VASGSDEEARLRAVALQNAQSILVARRRAEEEQRKQSQWLRITLASIGDGVITTDADGRVTFMNDVAQALTGWVQADALGHLLHDVFVIVHEGTRQPVDNPAMCALQTGTVIRLANHTMLLSREGDEHPIDDSAAPIRDESGATVGAVLVFRDVSERKATELTRAHLASIVESSEDAIVSKTLQGIILSWNTAAERLFGYTAREAIGNPITMLIPSERREEEREILARIARGDRIEPFETVRVTKDGRPIDISLTVSPIRDASNEIVGASKVARDISRRKALEARERFLVELDDAVRQLSEAEAITLAAARALGEHLDVNRCAYATVEEDGDTFQLTGNYTNGVDSIVGRYRFRQFGEECLRLMRAGEPYVVADSDSDPRITGPDRVSYSLTAIRAVICVPILKEGRFVAAMAVHTVAPRAWQPGEVELVQRVAGRCWESIERARVTERERLARRDAELQKGLLYSLFMQAPTLIAVLRGPNHVIELANPPICESWGHAEADLINRPLWDALPELRDQVFRSLLDEVYKTGVPYVGKETPVTLTRRGRGTETFYFNFVYSPFQNAEGSIEGIFVIASDVTEQVLARNQLNDLREAAESANRAKDEFLAMLGHELRNPLSPILTALQLMRLRDSDGLERERTVIERQVSHLTRLVDDLLDVSRIARGKVELKEEIVEIAEVVARAIETASPLFEQRTHILDVDIPRRGLPVKGDSMRLSQVVANLATNAAKYTPAGGRITIRAAEEQGEVVLRVRDTGIGIAADVLPHVFDLFVQERQAIDRSHGGLGLGLTIVRNLLVRHGGTVSAHSDGPGTGSEFVVRLPKAAQAPASENRQAVAPVPEPAAVLAAGSLKILVVDDSVDGADMLSMALSAKGYDTRVANDAPAALRIAAEFRPAVAFLDIGLPVMDGYELAARLRELPDLNGLRLIALTGYGQESDRQRTREAGFQHHLVKPVDLLAIETVLGEVMSKPRNPA
jgi:PAS domain S-box-containing protein